MNTFYMFTLLNVGMYVFQNYICIQTRAQDLQIGGYARAEASDFYCSTRINIYIFKCFCRYHAFNHLVLHNRNKVYQHRQMPYITAGSCLTSLALIRAKSFKRTNVTRTHMAMTSLVVMLVLIVISFIVL